jgi:hypothetical protein
VGREEGWEGSTQAVPVGGRFCPLCGGSDLSDAEGEGECSGIGVAVSVRRVDQSMIIIR